MYLSRKKSFVEATYFKLLLLRESYYLRRKTMNGREKQPQKSFIILTRSNKSVRVWYSSTWIHVDLSENAMLQGTAELTKFAILLAFKVLTKDGGIVACGCFGVDQTSTESADGHGCFKKLCSTYWWFKYQPLPQLKSFSRKWRS